MIAIYIGNGQIVHASNKRDESRFQMHITEIRFVSQDICRINKKTVYNKCLLCYTA